MRGGWTLVTKPQGNPLDGLAGLQQVHRCHVANGVRGDVAIMQARHRRACRHHSQREPLRDIDTRHRMPEQRIYVQRSASSHLESQALARPAGLCHPQNFS